MDFSILRYDEGFHPPKTSKSMCGYTSLLSAQVLVPMSQRRFESNWVAAQVSVNGKADRRVGCVIAEDQMRYLIFDLDHDEEVEDDEDDEEEESMEVDA